MNESNAIRIANVKYKGDYTLRLRWANDKALTVDLREPVFRLKGMRPLRDTAAFALAGVGEGGHGTSSHGRDGPSFSKCVSLGPVPVMKTVAGWSPVKAKWGALAGSV